MRPSALRVYLKIDGAILALCASFYAIVNPVHMEPWWWLIISQILILLVLQPLFILRHKAPQLIEFSDTQITIATLGDTASYQWTDLIRYKTGGVLSIQFAGRLDPYQIFSEAYEKDCWKKLIQFLKTKFPERENSGI